jgi:Arc/MetJ-type ribon-helix-helix transcriptional regulator
MKSHAMHNFHVPLPPDLHEMLRDEVEKSGEAATDLARQALREWLRERQRRRLHAEIAAYARQGR